MFVSRPSPESPSSRSQSSCSGRSSPVSPGAGGPERSYRVKPGDTLWSIAERTFPGDPREGVWELRERNELDGTTIVPGQVLVLPA